MKEIDLLIEHYKCDIPTSTESPGTVLLGDALGHLRAGSFLLPGLLLSVPFIQPLSLGPLATACSLAFILMGWQIWRGDESLTLPRKLRDTSLPIPLWCKLLHAARKVFAFINRFTSVRFTLWTDGVRGQKFTGIMVVIGGLLMAVPFIGVPLNNTFPALMILFALAGFHHRDGLLSLLSIFWGFISIIYFALITAVLIQSGRTLLQVLVG